jgi:hypothetical protein
MSVEEIFRFSCDAPGCPEKKEVVAQEAQHADVPDGWHDEQVGETHLIGCCEAHICAAIVRELGYETVAEAMMDLKVPEREPQSEIPTPPPELPVADTRPGPVPGPAPETKPPAVPGAVPPGDEDKF